MHFTDHYSVKVYCVVRVVFMSKCAEFSVQCLVYNSLPCAVCSEHIVQCAVQSCVLNGATEDQLGPL